MSKSVSFRVEATSGLTESVVGFCGHSCILLARKCAGRTSPVCNFIFAALVFSLRFHRYLSTYAAAFFSLPVKLESGEVLGHEEVVNQLDDLTVSYEVGLGLSDQFTEFVCISFKVEISHYESAVTWLRDLVWGTVFDKERLLVSAAKLAQSLPELKRDGNNVLSSVSAEALFDKSSTSLAGSILSQAEFVPKLIKELQEFPEHVIAAFEKLRKYLTDPAGIRISVTGNVLGVKKPRSIWSEKLGHLGVSTSFSDFASLFPLFSRSRLWHQVKLTCETLSELGRNPIRRVGTNRLRLLLACPAIESSFVNHTTKGIQGFDHPEFPALRVALEVLNATESFLWRSVRGAGLAYGAYVTADREAGLITFSLYRASLSSNNMEAFKEVNNVISGLVDGSIELGETTLDGAKSSIVYAVTKNVATAGRAAINSFTNQALKGLSQDHNLQLLEQYQAVTKDDVLASLKKYILPIFSPSTSTVVVVTAPSKVDQIAEGLTGYGFDVEKRTLEVEGDEDGSFESNSVSEDGSEYSR
ncbi:Metalloenzyme, LuxS/M16 peptidase-like protein [Lanmaoa asiatica]|nr:Metalloenzyme, LuxS/M16 peptidase-like protein [Lanmaoa asiatica]